MIDLGPDHQYEPMLVGTRVVTQDCNGPADYHGEIVWARSEGEGFDVSTGDYYVKLDKIPDGVCSYYFWELRPEDG